MSRTKLRYENFSKRRDFSLQSYFRETTNYFITAVIKQNLTSKLRLFEMENYGTGRLKHINIP